MEALNKDNENLGLSSEIQSALDDCYDQIRWLKGLAALIVSQCELSESFQSCYLSKGEMGDVGSLLSHHLEEIEGLIDKIYPGGISNGRDK